MCEKGNHEELCPGVAICWPEKRCRVYMGKFRRTLGIRYAGMSDSELLLPVMFALEDFIQVGSVTVVEVHLTGGYLRIPVGEGGVN